VPNKILLAISLLTSLAALSATAQAGETISDKRYWPSEAKPSGNTTTAVQDAQSAFASSVLPLHTESLPKAYESAPAAHYHGGAKAP
jgi:hypothetical protein